MANELAVVTGASTGIGYELARCCAADGADLVLCADEPEIRRVAEEFRQTGVSVEAVEADLGTEQGVEELWSAIDGRPVAMLLANAGRGLGNAFLDQDLAEAKYVVDVNVTGTISLVHKVGRQMRERGQGRILIVSSIAGLMPGSLHAVYNATKAFLDSFSWALRDELRGTGVTVTCLMPGPTDTEFFARANMLNTPLGADESKDDPGMVARQGYEAMKKGEAGTVTGLRNKIQARLAGITPDSVLARMHRRTAEPRDR